MPIDPGTSGPRVIRVAKKRDTSLIISVLLRTMCHYVPTDPNQRYYAYRMKLTFPFCSLRRNSLQESVLSLRWNPGNAGPNCSELRIPGKVWRLLRARADTNQYQFQYEFTYVVVESYT